MKHKKVIALILALTMLVPCLPMVGHAANDTGISVTVKSEPASIGGEAMVKVSLAGYDAEDPGIAGLQVDITGLETTEVTLAEYASLIEDADVLSNTVSYNENEHRVRLLYLSESGVIPVSCKDVMRLSFDVDPDLTEAGSVALPVTVKIVTEDNQRIEQTTSCIISYVDATPAESFEYTLDAENGVLILTEYTGSETAVVVAPTYTVDGVTYTTVLDASTVFRNNETITTVKINDGVKFEGNTMSRLFSGCSKLTSVDMSGVDTTGVTDMSYMYTDCSALTSIDMTGVDTSAVTTMYGMFSKCKNLSEIAGYQDWDTSSLQVMRHVFNYVQSLDVVDLSKWDLSQVINSGWCFQYCYASQILLPDSLNTISAGFMNHAAKYEGTSFTIPAGVQKIGYGHTFYDFSDDDFVEFKVADGNENYVAVDGILYSADGKEMLAIPRGKTFEDNTYIVPEGVEFLGELSFSRNYNIQKVVLPNSFEIKYVSANDPAYILVDDSGNLNAGSNLNIAIYCYTGVTEYAVKDDNPRYTSVDGIIYSKDMSTVVAVPSRYNQVMNIPEGVISWGYEAMWADDSTTVDGLMKDCIGVSIPSTMTDISEEQLAKLNRLKAKSDNFEISVDANNPVYGVDAEGKLVVKGSVVARNTTTRKAYTTVANALMEAQAGETVILLTDCAENRVLVTPEVTLDLNGHTLTANYVVAFGCGDVIDSTREGLLIVKQRNIVLDKDNAYVPVWNGENGYSFTQLAITDNKSGMGLTADGDVAVFKFVTFFRNTEGLTDGVTDNDLSVVVRVSWKTASGAAYQDFVYNDEHVGTVVQANGRQAFVLTFTGCESLADLTFTPMVISGTNAEFCGNTHSMP